MQMSNADFSQACDIINSFRRNQISRYAFASQYVLYFYWLAIVLH